MSVGELHNGHHMRGWVRQPSGYRPMGTLCSQLKLGTDSQGKQHGHALGASAHPVGCWADLSVVEVLIN
jgi:hypothetical protein